MPGELEKYIAEFQKYVKKSGIQKPQKPILKPEEEKIVEKIEKEIISKPDEVIVVPHFDREKFHEEVLKDVVGKYSVKNACTIAYTARDKGFFIECNHINEAIEYWEYLAELFELAFVEIWGYGYSEALEDIKNRKPGCPTCSGNQYSKCGFSTLEAKAAYLGLGYRTSLRDLKEAKSILEAVKKLEEEKFNIKKLGKISLLQIGIWARYLR